MCTQALPPHRSLSRINICIGASDWGVNGEEGLQDCDKRRSEKIAEHASVRMRVVRSFAVDKSVNNLVAWVRRS